MNAKQQIREMLKEMMPEGEANACEIFKGFAVDTGENGWHYKHFGRSEHHYMGKSLREAKEFVEEDKALKEFYR